MNTEDFKAFMIPAESRDKYFEAVEKAHDIFPRSMRANGDIDGYSDPIVKFNGWTAMSEKCQQWWTLQMRIMKAKDVTDTFADC